MCCITVYTLSRAMCSRGGLPGAKPALVYPETGHTPEESLLTHDELAQLLALAGTYWPRGGGIVPPDPNACPQEAEAHHLAMFDVLGDLDYALGVAALTQLRRDPSFRYVPDVGDLRRAALALAGDDQGEPRPVCETSAETAWQYLLAASRYYADRLAERPNLQVEWREREDGAYEKVSVEKFTEWRAVCGDLIASFADRRGGMARVVERVESPHLRRDFDQWWAEQQQRDRGLRAAADHSIPAPASPEPLDGGGRGQLGQGNDLDGP